MRRSPGGQTFATWRSSFRPSIAGRPTALDLNKSVTRLYAANVRSARILRAGSVVTPAWLSRVMGWAASVLLIGFHAWLLWAHAASGRLFEPDVAVRWALGVGLFGAILSLRAIGVPALFGRRAAVLWVLVSVLHWHAMSARVPSPTDVGLGLPAEVVVATTAASLGAVGLGLALLGVLLALRGASLPQARRWVLRSTPIRVTPSLAHLRVVGCRPPPAFSLSRSIR